MDNEVDQVFHCDQCGLCRGGSRETCFHCDKCDTCIDVKYKLKHKCVKGGLKQDCPICMVDLHTSRAPLQFLKCGHALHS